MEQKQKESDMERKLHKSKNDKWIAGVCGGLAEYSGVSSGLIRLLVVLSGIGIFAYLLAAVIIPPAEE